MVYKMEREANIYCAVIEVVYLPEMATQEQYQFFKDQYNDEENRYLNLTKRGEIYFSILSLIFSASIFKIKDIIEILDKISITWLRITIIVLLIISFLLFSIAFYFVVRSLKIRVYEGVIDFDNYLTTLGKAPPQNVAFFDDRIIDYIAATKKNENVNTSRAEDLEVSLKFIVAGFIFLGLHIILLISTKLYPL